MGIGQSAVYFLADGTGKGIRAEGSGPRIHRGAGGSPECPCRRAACTTEELEQRLNGAEEFPDGGDGVGVAELSLAPLLQDREPGLVVAGVGLGQTRLQVFT